MKLFLLFLVCYSSISSKTVFLDKEDLKSISSFQILDVRNIRSFQQQNIKGSVHIDVNTLNDVKSIQSSLLLSQSHLQDSLRLQGVKSFKNYLILGLGIHKWGEDGRLYWLLDNSSTANVYLYDGGYKQFSKDFPGMLTQDITLVKKGDIVLDKQWTPFSYSDLKSFQGSIVDVRTTAEFLGATPFGSAKGGRINGAISIPWSDFFTPHGLINNKNKSSIVNRLSKDKNTVVYCTAGYRSALVYAVLKDWDISVNNYDGSWFEYAKRSK